MQIEKQQARYLDTPLMGFLFLMMLFFLAGIAAVHLFDWDEINFAESAREMLVTGNYTRVQIDFQPFWEKPPLFFWLQAASMKAFGINAFAARLPNVFFGVLTLYILFRIALRVRNRQFAWWVAMLYAGALLPHVYFKSGIIDPVFNFFIFTSVCTMIYTLNAPAHTAKWAFLAGVLNGLAVLTKGPVGLLILLLTFLVYMAITRFYHFPKWRDVLVLAVGVFLTSFLWYGLELIKNGWWFIGEFIDYQLSLFSEPVAGHGQPFYYHFIVVFLGCFPMSVFALPGFTLRRPVLTMDFHRWMLVLFWVVMILFSIVHTKIVHYSSMAYFPLAFLAAGAIERYTAKNIRPPRWVQGLYLGLGLLIGVLLAAVPLVAMHGESLVHLVKDPFVQAAFLTPAQWQGTEYLLGVFWAVGIWAVFFLLRAKKFTRALFVHVLVAGLTLSVAMRWVVPKVETYTQGPLVTFCQELQGQDVYLETAGFKSYAHYFYFRKQPWQAGKHITEDWLLTGEIDKPAYFVTKIHKKDKLKSYKEVHWIKDTGGYSLFRRNPEK